MLLIESSPLVHTLYGVVCVMEELRQQVTDSVGCGGVAKLPDERIYDVSSIWNQLLCVLFPGILDKISLQVQCFVFAAVDLHVYYYQYCVTAKGASSLDETPNVGCVL